MSCDDSGSCDGIHATSTYRGLDVWAAIPASVRMDTGSTHIPIMHVLLSFRPSRGLNRRAM